MDVEVTDKQVNERLEQLKKQFYGGDDKKFKASLKKLLLLTEDQVKKDARPAPGGTALQEGHRGPKGQRQGNRGLLHQEQGAVPAGRYAEVRHILVKTKKKADQIHAQLEAGGNFTN